MKPICSFVTKFASLFSWVLSCFDRVLFKGHLPICRGDQLEGFVDYVLRMRRCDFMEKTAPHWSDRLVGYAKSFARRRGRLYEFRQGQVDKDAWAKEQKERCAVVHGLIGVLCVMESCWTFKLGSGEGRPCFVPRQVPQRVLYYYFFDKDLGLMHVRLQTWAPFTCQVYVNGHDYVARQLAQRGYSFKQLDNAFLELSDPAEAQRLANRFAKLPWPKILNNYARQVNPLLGKELKDFSHYWVIDQAEFATDLLFVSKHALA